MKGLELDSQTDSEGRHTMVGGLASPDGFPVYAAPSRAVHYTNRPYYHTKGRPHKQTQISKQIFKLILQCSVYPYLKHTSNYTETHNTWQTT